MKYVPIFFAGLLFGGGLVVSGMINPQKVINFLDVFGDWDASLAFVMGGAVAVMTLGYRIVQKRERPLFDTSFSIPNRTDIDRNLIVGASLFGVGWGLVGFCPGPAIAALSVAPSKALIFVISMLVGMFIARRLKSGNLSVPKLPKGVHQ